MAVAGQGGVNITTITIPPINSQHTAQICYVMNGNDKKMLGAMATGVVDPNDAKQCTISCNIKTSYGRHNRYKRSCISNYYQLSLCAYLFGCCNSLPTV